MPRVRRQKTEHAGSFRVFDVLRHELEDEQGRAAGTVFTMACPDWVSVVPMTSDGRFVLVRQHRHGVDAMTLEPPGGMVNRGEEPAAAALRELAEETGYAGGALTSLGVCHPNPVLQDNRHHMFLVRGVERVGDPVFDSGEFCEVVVLGRRELERCIERGEISHALALLSLARAFAILPASGIVGE